MNEDNKIKQIVVGYTLDAVLEAHNLAMNEENEVVLYCTGELGEPLDSYNDYLSYDDAKRLGFITNGLGYSECVNNSYIYIPYELIKFKNSTNGIMQYPFNKNSFDDEKEWKDVCEASKCDDIKEILSNASNSPTRLITMYKNNLPKWFVDSVVRNVSNTRWSGIPTSTLTLNGFLYEFSLNEIEDEAVHKWYMPEFSYKCICEKIIKKDNIKVIKADKDVCFDLITNRDIENVTFMDNRVDYYLDYRLGMFDRREMCVVKSSNLPDYMTDINSGFVRTPTMEYWGVNIYGNTCKQFYCKPMSSISNVPMSLIPMTKNNMRMYDAYSKILPLYGKNKILNLQQKIKTLIK